MAKRSDGCSGETLRAPCARKKLYLLVCLKNKLGPCSIDRHIDGMAGNYSVSLQVLTASGFCDKKKSALTACQSEQLLRVLV